MVLIETQRRKGAKTQRNEWFFNTEDTESAEDTEILLGFGFRLAQ